MNKKEITTLIRNIASHFGERVSCEWLSPDGIEWIEWKNAEISVQFLMDLEKGYIRNIQIPQSSVTILQDEIKKLKAEKKELACRLNGLSAALIMVLKVKALSGCIEKNWLGFQNGNGTDIGKDMERLIKRAEKEQKYLLTIKHE